MATIFVDVVSAEEAIFSGEAKFVALPGQEGELGILPGHVPLITRIRPGAVRITTQDGAQENVFVAGGILEVQPDRVTVLADTAIRSKDLDEAKRSRRSKKRSFTAPRRRAIWKLPSSKRPWRPWLRRSPTSSVCGTNRKRRPSRPWLGNGSFPNRPAACSPDRLAERAVFFCAESQRRPPCASIKTLPPCGGQLSDFQERISRWTHKTLRM